MRSFGGGACGWSVPYERPLRVNIPGVDRVSNLRLMGRELVGKRNSVWGAMEKKTRV